MADLEGELRALGLGGARAAVGALSMRAEDYSNAGGLEQAWALKAIKYAETHFKLIQSVDAASLTLTRRDEELYQRFQKKFQGMKVVDPFLPTSRPSPPLPQHKVDRMSPDDLKSPEAKESWRNFCKEFEGIVTDYNFGTLLRLDCSQDYSEENTILVPRVQFLAVEIARNRLGLNSVHFSPQS